MPKPKIAIRVELTLEEHKIYQMVKERATQSIPKTTARAVIVDGLKAFIKETNPLFDYLPE